MEKGHKVKSYNVSKDVEAKVEKGEVPKASCLLSVGKTIFKTIGAYHKLKLGFEHFTL